MQVRGQHMARLLLREQKKSKKVRKRRFKEEKASSTITGIRARKKSGNRENGRRANTNATAKDEHAFVYT